MKLKPEEMIDYLDGTLDAARKARVEARLADNAEDALLLAQMKEATAALRDMDEAAPVRVSDDFWPRLRERLPEAPPRRPLRAATAQIGGWLWPSRSPFKPFKLSAGVAALAVFVWLAVLSLSPQGTVQKAQADLSAADKAFITQSLARHDAYEMAQSLNATNALREALGPLDDGEDDGGEDDDYAP